MEALEPWLLARAPIYNRDAGLTLFQEADTDRLWLQEGSAPNNPYGDNAARPVSWPDPMAGMAIDTGERPSTDPHAGHR